MASKYNDSRKDVVDTITKVFCKRLGIKFPFIYYSIKEYNDVHRCCDWRPEHLYGVSCLDCKCIAVDLDDKRNNDILTLVDTIAHELIHIAYDVSDHPKWFDRRVECLIKGKKIR